VGTSFFRFVSMQAFDRRTDRQTEGQKGQLVWTTVRCIACSDTVK